MFTEPASQEKQSDPPMMYQLGDVSTMDESNSDATNGQIEETQNKSDEVFVESGAPTVEETVTQVEQEGSQPLMYTFNNQSETAVPEQLTSNKVATQVAPPKEAEPVAIVKKDPGWYKQMFQQFQNTVEEQFPGGNY